MITLILLEIEHPGNLGAIARLMANFNVQQLVLINPKCAVADQDAKNRAKHAQTILDKAIIADIFILKSFDYLIGTTARLGRDYNIPRSPLLPEQLPALLHKKNNIGLLFGREGIGLTNEEIKLCDFTITIPTSKKYPSLNISHAVAIVLYELYKDHGKENIQKQFPAIGEKEKEHLMKKINGIIKKLDFGTTLRNQTQQMVWKKVIAKSMLTQREAFALFGFFRKVDEKVK